MKKTIFALIITLAMIGTGFSAPIYDASMDVLMDTYGPGDALTVFGFIDHTTGDGTLTTSSLTLRFYNALSGPGLATTITSVEYISAYENPDNLLLDGAYLATRTLSGLSNGDYFVEVLINGEVENSAQFTYDDSIDRNSTLNVPSSYITAGNINVGYTITKTNTVEDVIYDLEFYTPTVNGLGNAKKTDSLTVTNTNTSSHVVSFTSLEFADAANILVVKVVGTNQTTQDIPNGYARLWLIGGQSTISTSGSLSMNFNNCEAKEEAVRTCTFTVNNTGDYPTSYSISADSELTTTIDFSTGLMQPGTSRTGTLSITASEGDTPSKTLSLNLMQGSTILQTITGTVSVEARDLINELSILEFEVSPTDVRPGDEVVVSFKLSNTGDFTERVKVQYAIGDENPVTLANTYTILAGQTRTVSINFNAPDEEFVTFELNILKDDEVIDGRITDVYIEQFTFTPFTIWESEYRYLEQGSTANNRLKVRNDGNTPEFYTVNIMSTFASLLNHRIYLLPGEHTNIDIPIRVLENAEVGVHTIDAEVCSLTSAECDTDEFTLTILELEVAQSTIVANSTMQQVSSGEGAVFEVSVQNFEGSTETYSLSVENFNGELQISPSTLTLMNGEEGNFYLFAKPEEQVTQDITYQVLMGTEVVSTGNLTMSYGLSGLTGLITLSEAGSIGAMIIGVTLIAALVFLGVKSFNQSKVELKYWK